MPLLQTHLLALESTYFYPKVSFISHSPNLTHETVYCILSSVYLNALLASLNARRTLKEASSVQKNTRTDICFSTVCTQGNFSRLWEIGNVRHVSTLSRYFCWCLPFLVITNPVCNLTFDIGACTSNTIGCMELAVRHVYLFLLSFPDSWT